MDARVIEGALIAAPVALWFGVYGTVLAATRPFVPDPAPATEDLGPEPPAVASMLVNQWEVTEDAAESTLLDLGARHILEFRQPANDPMQTTVHVRQTSPAGLNPYEQLVFNRVAGLAAGGVVPLTALTFRDKAEAKAWGKRLTAEVVAEARSHDLSQRRLGKPIVSALTIAAGLVGLSITTAVIYYLNRQPHPKDVIENGLYAGLFTWFVLSAIGARSHGERDTPAGREVASRWLGVRAWLRGHEAFADLPPAAVAVWDRYMSYGAAVGATRLSSAVIDLGMGNRRRVWSSYGGSSGQPAWHRVRVRYPKFWPRYGKTAPRTIVKAVIVGAIGIVLIRFWYRTIDNAFSVKAVHDSVVNPFNTLLKSVGLLVGGLFVVYGVYMIVRTIIDLAAPVTLTGEVVWTELWRSTTKNDNSQPSLYYLALDDATGDTIRAWALPAGLAGQCRVSDVATITARRWSRRVTEVTVVAHGNARKLAQATIGTSTDTDAMIAAAMGIPTARTGGFGGFSGALGLATPLTPLGPLVTVEEVGAALGMPVTLSKRGANRGGAPMEVTEYAGPDGKPVLTVMRSGGMIARMAMRSRSRGQDLPGIGDEARGGPGWIVARRGNEVIMMNLGQASQGTPPGNFANLAYTAASRLPAQVS